MADLLEDPNQIGLLSLGLRLMSTPGKFGTALGQSGLGAMGDMQQAKAAQQAARTRALQEQQMMMQLEELKRDQAARQKQAERQQAIEGAFRNSFESPATQALAAGGGPTVGNAQAMQGMQPRMNQQRLIAELMQADPVAAYKMSVLPPDETKVVGDALVSIGPGGAKELYRAPQKADKDPTSIQEYRFAVGQGYKGTFEEWDRSSKRAGATNVTQTNTPGIPATLIKQQDDLIDKMTTARAIEADLGQVAKMIDGGKLEFGPVRNLVNQGRNIAGVSSEESRNFATFKSTLEKLRNDSLRLNTGVQTEGDAQRAWNELFQGINDKNLVRQRLGEISAINRRAAGLHQYRLGVLRSNSGAGALPEASIPPALNAPSGGGTLEDLLKKYGN